MPRRTKRGGKQRGIARPACRRPRQVTKAPKSEPSEASEAPPTAPTPAARAIPTLRTPPSPVNQTAPEPPMTMLTRAAAVVLSPSPPPLPPPPPPLPPSLRTRSMTLAPGPPASSLSSGTAPSVDTDDVPLAETPLKRRRRQPQRFCNKVADVVPEKKSMFELISRDSLQRYMVHYQIPKRQDLKKNLVRRVQKHFDQMDVSDIDLVALHSGVRERLTRDARNSGKTADRK